MPALLLLLPLLTGCGLNEDEFPWEYAEVSCELGISCGVERYAGYADVDECLPESAGAWQEVAENGDGFGCPLDYSYARACLKDYRDASCDSFESGAWESESEDCAAMFLCGESASE
jgi:hypothetical protein